MVLTGLGWLIAASTLVVAALNIHAAFAIVFTVALVGFGWAMLSIKCPRCRYPVMKMRPGLSMSPWGGRFPRHCPKCGLSSKSDWPANEIPNRHTTH